MQNIKTEPNTGSRFLAGLIDYIIIYGFTFFLVFAIGEPNDEGGYSLNGMPALIPMIFWKSHICKKGLKSFLSFGTQSFYLQELALLIKIKNHCLKVIIAVIR